MDGVIVIDKPEGWTSHDVVNKVRRIAKTKKVGHLGTLDPIATGVLPLVIERATRLAQFYTRSDKIYEGIVRFGWSTTTYDRAGEPTSYQREVTIDAEELDRHLERFRGEFAQTPPPVSAKKVDGKRAYELVRDYLKGVREVMAEVWGENEKFMFTRDVSLKALIRVLGDLLQQKRVIQTWEEERSARAFRGVLQPWAELTKEFRTEGFYERFPAKGQVERVRRIHLRLMEALHQQQK